MKDKELKLLIASAKNSNVTSQFKLGNLYFDGITVKKNYDLAVKWFANAAINGHKESEIRLFRYYDEVEGFKDSFLLAVEVFKKNIKFNTIAEYLLGKCYLEGRGCNINLGKAEKYLLNTAKHGNEISQYLLGVMYYKKVKNIITKNVEVSDEYMKTFSKAEKFFVESAEQGYAEAEYTLGVIYSNEPFLDSRKSIYWYQNAAAHQHKKAIELMENVQVEPSDLKDI